MGAIVGLFGRMLLWLVSTYAGQWVLKILVSLGLTVVVHQVAMPNIMSFLQSKLAGMPAFLVTAFGAMGFDVACSMIVSTAIAVTAGKLAVRATANA